MQKANLIPLLIARSMIEARCHYSIAERVMNATRSLPEQDGMILWLRMNGHSYKDIGEMLNVNQGSVWRVVNTRIKNQIYSILESSAYAMVSEDCES